MTKTVKAFGMGAIFHEWKHLGSSRYCLQMLELSSKMFSDSRQKNVDGLDAVEVKKVLCMWMIIPPVRG